MQTVKITKEEIMRHLYAESTNASRTYMRNDGVSEFEKIVIDEQEFDSLEGSYNESASRLAEKMHEFIDNYNITSTFLQYDFSNDVKDGVKKNMTEYVVCAMMSDWLSSVRPDFVQRYEERKAQQLDDLLRKLYKKDAPV